MAPSVLVTLHTHTHPQQKYVTYQTAQTFLPTQRSPESKNQFWFAKKLHKNLTNMILRENINSSCTTVSHF